MASLCLNIKLIIRSKWILPLERLKVWYAKPILNVPGVRHLACIALEYQRNTFAEHRNIVLCHYNDVIAGAMASQITRLTNVYSTVYSGADQGKHQSSASRAFVWGINRWPVNSPDKGPVTRKMFPFDDVIISIYTVVDRWYTCCIRVNCILKLSII